MIIFLLVLSFIPNFIWLIFFLKEDPHPEPSKSLIIAFFLGILAAYFMFSNRIRFKLYF